MKTFRFVTTTHHHVSADNLDEAIAAFEDELKRRGRENEVRRVSRIDVLDEGQDYVPVDRPMRAEYMNAE